MATDNWQVGDRGSTWRKERLFTVLQVLDEDTLAVVYKDGGQGQEYYPGLTQYIKWDWTKEEHSKVSKPAKRGRRFGWILLLILIILGVVIFNQASETEATMIIEAPATEAPMIIEAPATEAPMIIEAPATEAPAMEALVETKCITPSDSLPSYLEAFSQEAFVYNQIPTDFGGKRYVVAVTYKDGSRAILYGESGSTWTPDETVATAMVNLVKAEGYETSCLANGLAEYVKPSLGELPVVMIP